MTQKIFIVFFLMMTSSIYCQSKSKVNIFLDENLNTINKASFIAKQNSFLYYSNTQIKDTLIIHRIFENIRFGKFDSSEYNQVRMGLEKDSKNIALKDKKLILTFRDTLFNFEKFKKHRKSSNISQIEYDRKIKRFDKNQKKCIKKDGKNNYKRLYFYAVNKGYDYVPENFTWQQSSNLLNRILFKNHSGMMILKPNGDYFYFGEIYEKLTMELLATDNWEPFITDYEIAKINLAQNTFGKLKTISKSHEEAMRFYAPSLSTNCYYYGD